MEYTSVRHQTEGGTYPMIEFGIFGYYSATTATNLCIVSFYFNKYTINRYHYDYDYDYYCLPFIGPRRRAMIPSNKRLINLITHRRLVLLRSHDSISTQHQMSVSALNRRASYYSHPLRTIV